MQPKDPAHPPQADANRLAFQSTANILSVGSAINNTAGLGRLVMLSGDQQGREYLLQNRVTSVGRAINNDIVIADRQTSRHHLQIIYENNSYAVVDTASANGFYVNDLQVNRAPLRNGDVITIGSVKMAFVLNPVVPVSSSAPATTVTPALPNGKTETNPLLPTIDLQTRPVTAIGREPGVNEIVLDSPQVSRRHLQIFRQKESFVVRDLDSTNGTFCNGQRLDGDTVLSDGDLLNIGPYRFMFTRGTLNRTLDDDSVRIDVLNLGKAVNKQIILHNITFTILPHEFVAIVGGSGAGKSTLLDAISGVRPANSGAVLYNKANYYHQMEVYRSSTGYVPQDDIVPVDLTVYQALYYAARLRLPRDTSKAEIEARLDELLDELDLSDRRDVVIRKLSGGQRKRVSIGAELISRPSLFFLDEPTSGLDPGLETRTMQLLRKLADQGRTVVLITHATQNLALCDQILFLTEGGHVAFYGTPAEALSYFEVASFADIYVRLQQERSPLEWAAAFRSSPYYSRNVLSRLRAVAAEAVNYGVSFDHPESVNIKSLPATVSFRRNAANLSGWSQFLLLTNRYYHTLIGDKRNLALLLLQAPIIGLLLLIGFGRNIFDVQGGDFAAAKTLTFLLVIITVWFGTNNAARELVKEAAIYRRERRIGLKFAPYLASKLVIQFGLILVQVAMLLAIVWLGLGLGNPSLATLVGIFSMLLLVAGGGVMLGLALSAINKNSDRVASTVPIVLIPQIIFGGAVIALDKMGFIGQWLGDVMVSNWGFHALGALLRLDQIPNQPVKVDGLSLPPEMAPDIANATNNSLIYNQANGNWYFTPGRAPEFSNAVLPQALILFALIILSLLVVIYFQLRKDKDVGR